MAATDPIASRILVLRGQRVMLDQDLAALYGVTAKRFNEQVLRNAARFPPDFMFRLTNQEFAILRPQFATSSWGGRGDPAGDTAVGNAAGCAEAAHRLSLTARASLRSGRRRRGRGG